MCPRRFMVPNVLCASAGPLAGQESSTTPRSAFTHAVLLRFSSLANWTKFNDHPRKREEVAKASPLAQSGMIIFL